MFATGASAVFLGAKPASENRRQAGWWPFGDDDPIGSQLQECCGAMKPYLDHLGPNWFERVPCCPNKGPIHHGMFCKKLEWTPLPVYVDCYCSTAKAPWVDDVCCDLKKRDCGKGIHDHNDTACWWAVTVNCGAHPGAHYCVRLADQGEIIPLPGESPCQIQQQCCYDISDNLITDPPGAGSADICGESGYGPVMNPHVDYDVAPYKECPGKACGDMPWTDDRCWDMFCIYACLHPTCKDGKHQIGGQCASRCDRVWNDDWEGLGCTPESLGPVAQGGGQPDPSQVAYSSSSDDWSLGTANHYAANGYDSWA